HALLTIPYFLVTALVLKSEILASSPILIFALMYLGILAGVVYAVLLSRVYAFSWMGRIGQLTLPIYLMHSIPILGLEKVLTSTLPSSFTYLAVILLLITGVILPIFIFNVANKLKFGWLFSSPFSAKRKGVPQTEHREVTT